MIINLVTGESNQLISISRTATVLELKRLIATKHPCKPIVSSQRLINLGKLLKDTDLLEKLYVSDNIQVIVYLVAPGLHNSKVIDKSSSFLAEKDYKNIGTSEALYNSDNELQIPSQMQYRLVTIQYLFF